MRIRKLQDISAFEAGDKTRIKEVFHPDKHPVPLPYSLAHGELPVGACSLPHTLGGDEVYIFLKGKGALSIDDQRLEVNSDTVVRVPAGSVQALENTGAEVLVFYCIVSPPWREEEETIL
jgi:mannose-6-phosphate isomerase-like protein (cupin superfamily)